MTNTIDPLGGSYFVEELTDELERQAYGYFAKIDELGGMVEAVKTGYPQREIADAAFTFQTELDDGTRSMVGVTELTEGNELDDTELLHMDPASEGKQTRARGLGARRTATAPACRSTLADLREQAAREDVNLMPALLDCARAHCTEGEIVESLQQVWGKYTRDADVLSQSETAGPFGDRPPRSDRREVERDAGTGKACSGCRSALPIGATRPDLEPPGILGWWSDHRKRLVLVACILGSTVVAVDSTVVNVALPAIRDGPRRRLRRPAVDGQRLPDHAGLADPGRRLAGRRPGRAAGVHGWADHLGSLRCGARSRPRSRSWVLARALQGVSGALVSPTALAVIVLVFPARGAWQGGGLLDGQRAPSAWSSGR